MDISLEKQFGGEGVFANILHDESFKVVVGAPQNERLLIDIIGLLIPGKKISSITLINREQHGLSNWEKNTTARRTGLEEGRAEGLEEGRAEGRAEGAKERSLEIARALIREKVEPAIIASATGLTLEEIRAIS